MESGYRESHFQWLLALSTLHAAIDAALTDDQSTAAHRLLAGRQPLAACTDLLAVLGQSLVDLRSDLFESGNADATEPLLAREPLFATLDYDSLYRELAGRGAALPHCTFWDETASRLREGGARGGCL